MTDTETKLADALRELLDSHDHAVECDYADQRAADEREAAARVAARESLAAHDSARAQPASVADDLNEDAAWIRAFAIPSCERQTTRSGLEAIAKKLDLLAAPRLPAKESDR